MDTHVTNTATKKTAKRKTGEISAVRCLRVTAMRSAIAFILMFVDFPIPFLIPSFIELDISELPALIGSFALGPVWGVCICLVKNLLHLYITSTGGVGELSNFLLGAAFVLPAGIIYQHKKTKKNALSGAIVGAVFMGIICIPVNYFLT